jgi:hypothetical protein
MHLFTTVPILRFYIWLLEVIIETDMSDFPPALVISQNTEILQGIAIFFRRNSSTNNNYNIHNIQMLVVILVLRYGDDN